MAREVSTRPMTPQVVTVWYNSPTNYSFNFRYRAPELLFGAREYTKAMDIWSVGLIFGELLLHAPVLPGENEMEQVQLTIALLGCPPSEEVWPQFRNMPLRKEYWLPPPTESLANGKMTLKMRFREFSEATRGLMGKFLEWDPEKRCSARQGLQSTYFKEEPRGSIPFLACN
jgi:cyclin-dependent kinase 10